MKKIATFINSLSHQDLLLTYNILLEKLKSENLIRTKNIIGELAETFAIQHYKNDLSLPNLVISKTNNPHVDAVSETCLESKYAIKGTSCEVTSVFRKMQPDNQDVKYFDFLIIVVFSKQYELKNMYQITWEQFIQLRDWKTYQSAYNIRVSKKLKKEALQIF